jgi:hypothetical protein
MSLFKNPFAFRGSPLHYCYGQLAYYHREAYIVRKNPISWNSYRISWISTSFSERFFFIRCHINVVVLSDLSVTFVCRSPLKSLLVNILATSFNISKSKFVIAGFLWFLQQTMVSSLCKIDRLLLTTEAFWILCEVRSETLKAMQKNSCLQRVLFTFIFLASKFVVITLR